MYNSDDAILRQYQENTQQTHTSNNKFVKFDAKNYLDVRLKSGETKREIKIRFLPFSKDDSIPFGVIYTHYIKLKNDWKSIPCNKHTVKVMEDTIVSLKQNLKDSIQNNNTDLSQQLTNIISQKENDLTNYLKLYGRECPICTVSENAYLKEKECDTETEKKLFTEIKKAHRPIQTYVCRVIEVGKESEGPKFWKFYHSFKSDGMYDSLIKAYIDRKEEVGNNIFDLYNGCDIKLNINKNQLNKDEVSKAIIVSVKNNPVGTDEQIDSWVNDHKKWFDVYKPKPAQYSEIMLRGDIPVFDKATQRYIGQAELTEQNEAKAQAAAEDEKRIRANNYSNDGYQASYSDTDEDLPF